MDLQQTLNKIKRIIGELFDLLIKKQLDGLDENDKKRIKDIKSELNKILDNLNKNDVKVSIIQKAIQLAEELIDELEN